MIDTISIGIPLTESQFSKLYQLVESSDKWTWGRVNLHWMKQSNDPRDFVFMTRVKSVTTVKRGSWERDLIWSIPDRYLPNETTLRVEVSLPKLFYRGENIHLLYEPMKGLSLLKSILEKQFRLRLLDPSQWLIFRADIAYAWRLPSQDLAEAALDSLRKLAFPYKKPIEYPTSIYFPGATYTVKIYLKLPEFQAHDKKKLLKDASRLDCELQQRNLYNFIGFLECKATGVLRFEVEFHRQYFRDNKIKTVGEFLKPQIDFEVDPGLVNCEPGDPFEMFPFTLIFMHRILEGTWRSIKELFDSGEDGQRVEAPPGFNESPRFQALLRELESSRQSRDDLPEIPDDEQSRERCNQMKNYRHPGGGYTLRKLDPLLPLLRSMWIKFVGAKSGMADLERVETLLLERYQGKRERQKVAKLLGFWQYLKNRGANRAKEFYGRDAYYRLISDLKEAQVPLPGTIVTDADKKFLEIFDFAIPSAFVVNRQTEHPDTYDNLFNHQVVDQVD